MTPVPAHLRRSARTLGAALVALLAIAALALPAAAQAEQDEIEDRGILRAAEWLQRANEGVAAVENALDETAEQYEHANAHRIRIADELAAADARVAEANAAVAVAEDQLGTRIVEAYKRPTGPVAITDAILASPDASTALYRTGLYRRVVSSSLDEVDDAQQTSDIIVTDAQQEKVIAAGAQASVAEWQRQSRALTAALGQAQAGVEDAQNGLDAARAEAARRAEEQRRAAAAAQVVQVAEAPVGPPPSVDGRTCPIGAPNGFIDSWGFPRSGGRTHEGVDMFAAYGTPLFAVADGYIYRVYNNPLGGLSINLIDDAGNMYYYTHMSSAAVTTGQTIRMGEVIGAVGTSGNAAGTPPHLHWQFHPGNGAPVNPYPLAYALCRG